MTRKIGKMAKLAWLAALLTLCTSPWWMLLITETWVPCTKCGRKCIEPSDVSREAICTRCGRG